MSSPSHSSRSVCPVRALSRSSSARRLGSASALNTSSIGVRSYAAIWLPKLRSQMAACQAEAIDGDGSGGVRLPVRTEELAQLTGQQVGHLEGGEVAAAVEL